MDNPSRPSIFSFRKKNSLGMSNADSSSDQASVSSMSTNASSAMLPMDPKGSPQDSNRKGSAGSGNSWLSNKENTGSSTKSHHHHHHHHHHLSKFVRHVTMTPLESEAKKAAKKTHVDSVKESFKRETERWILHKKLNMHEKDKDAFTYCSTRLNLFLQLYDLEILESPTDEKLLNEKRDLVNFWSIQALKTLTGIDGSFASKALADFSNNDLKPNEKLKTLNMAGDYIQSQWYWQLAIDNPNTEVYTYTTKPILYTGFSEYRTSIGPSNHHIVHGNSLIDLPFSKDTFSAAVCYDLWLHLREEEWNPVLSETHRLLSPHGQIHLFMMDFTIVNCRNEIYRDFFIKVQNILDREGIDPFPCRKIQNRLKDVGFELVRYAFISLKKGLPNKLGNLMELVQSFFEYIIFTKIASMNLTFEELELFKEMRLQYNQDARNGQLLDEFGDSYYMFLFAQKP